MTFTTEPILDFQILFETGYTREIRISMAEGNVMKEHKTPFPIVIHLLEGEITVGISGQKTEVKKGDLLALDGNIVHDLLAKSDSIIRLTVSKSDSAERVNKVISE